jgi:hypothetical protein
MPANEVEKFGHLVAPHLRPSEQVLDIVASVVPVRGARGVGSPGLAGSVGTAAGNKLAQIGAVKGGKGSLADSFPHHLPPGSTRLLCVTSQRLLFLLSSPARKSAELVWEVPREAVQGVERRPRMQLLARFRLHFADGSAVSIMTLSRRNIESLAGELGRCRKGAPVT